MKEKKKGNVQSRCACSTCVGILLSDICRRVVNTEPHVNIKNIIVINIRIIVDIGVNKIRYLIRKYQIDPRMIVIKRIKCDEIFIGDASRNDDVSNPFAFIYSGVIPSLIRFGVECRRVLIWQWIVV